MFNNKEEKDKSAKILAAEALCKTVVKKNIKKQRLDLIQSDRKEQTHNLLKHLEEDSNGKTN